MFCKIALLVPSETDSAGTYFVCNFAQPIHAFPFMDGSEQGKPTEYYVLRRGETFGPLLEEDLRAGVADGRFELDNFVQVEGRVIWEPMGRILDAFTEKQRGAVAPDWKCISQWAWVRLRYSLGEQSVYAALVCVGMGVLALTLSRWPFVFWAPWFALAAAAALMLFRRKREGVGAVILLAVISIPALFHFVGSKAAPDKSASAGLTSSSAGEKGSAPEQRAAAAQAADAAATAPVKEPAINPGAESTPVTAAAPQAPVPQSQALVTITPHYGSVPAAPDEAPATDPATGPTLSATEKPSPPSSSELSKTASASATPSTPELQAAASTGKNPFTAAVEAAALAKERESNLMTSHNDAFVLVKGVNGSGSGFVCREGDKTWLFSNIHVISEIKQPTLTRLDGVTLAVGATEVAAGPDIARMVLSKPPEHPLEMITDFDANVRIDDEVMVLGNSGGGGVVTSLKGKIVGIGPDRIEVSAEFIPGNSGSPIVHLKTGKVIGIATYLTRRYEQAGVVTVRRFGYRLDKVPRWEPVNWNEIYAEADQLESISTLTGDVFDFLDALRNGKSPNFATDTLRRAAQDWAARVSSQHVSDSDRRSATQSFLSALRFMIRGDMAAAEGRFRYTYFRQRLQAEAKVRDSLYHAFDSEAAKLSTPLSRHSFR